MRNGMSVKEVYARLDQCDRLEARAAEEKARYDDLVNRVKAAIYAIDNTIRTYDMCTEDPKIEEQDMWELDGRADGLREAKEYLRRAVGEVISRS